MQKRNVLPSFPPPPFRGGFRIPSSKLNSDTMRFFLFSFFFGTGIVKLVQRQILLNVDDDFNGEIIWFHFFIFFCFFFSDSLAKIARNFVQFEPMCEAINNPACYKSRTTRLFEKCCSVFFFFFFLRRIGINIRSREKFVIADANVIRFHILSHLLRVFISIFPLSLYFFSFFTPFRIDGRSDIRLGDKIARCKHLPFRT